MTNATQLLETLTAMAVIKVSEMNKGKDLTEEQFTQRVKSVTKVALTKTLDSLAKSDPVAAKRIAHTLANGLS